ncbi:hypothetical protein BHE74_00053330 [Ensete ventricosum]|nr:hypothetical protein GW17_00021139 [Ensete ventricosum]RWW41197.1 hypothetical protein BHE74_00053330 [Ensete ventricosum]RZS16203.1 hypothetical protein BHM03_00048160 [Ensete ventricosum]
MHAGGAFMSANPLRASRPCWRPWPQLNALASAWPWLATIAEGLAMASHPLSAGYRCLASQSHRSDGFDPPVPFGDYGVVA